MLSSSSSPCYVYLIWKLYNFRNTEGTQGECNSSPVNGYLHLLLWGWFSFAMVRNSLLFFFCFYCLSLLGVGVVLFASVSLIISCRLWHGVQWLHER